MLGRILLALLAITVPTACASAKPITAVTVSDANGEVVKALTEEELAEFERLWAMKVKTDPGAINDGGDQLHLDIRTAEGAGHALGWQYDPSGVATPISIKVPNGYRIADPEAFNQLIGAKPQASAPFPRPSTLDLRPSTLDH